MALVCYKNKLNNPSKTRTNVMAVLLFAGDVHPACGAGPPPPLPAFFPTMGRGRRVTHNDDHTKDGEALSVRYWNGSCLLSFHRIDF